MGGVGGVLGSVSVLVCTQAAAPAPPDDPYAFLPKPDVNNGVHTTVNFSDGRIMRIANPPEVSGER